MPKWETAGFRILLETYAYDQALSLYGQHLPLEAQFLLTSLKERRELNVPFLYDHKEEMAELSDCYGLAQIDLDREKEQLINYLLDLEAKVRNRQIIDFVRAVSPMIYRLYLRLLSQEIPELPSYINNARNDQYDRWMFSRMAESRHPAIQAFISRKRDSRVTSSSLLDLLLEASFSEEVKAAARLLRQFERSVRNPLAHLIKPFDEEELHRTTGFSSQRFLEKLIALAKASGLSYDDTSFYFDQANNVVWKLINNQGWDSNWSL